MATLILTRGIPASGKSTWALEWVLEDPDHRARVNRDDLRALVYGDWYTKPEYEKEKVITKLQQQMVLLLLQTGKDVVVDDTNLRAQFVKQWYALWPDVEFKDFPLDVESAVFRDAKRASAGGRTVGEDVIRDFGRRFYQHGKLPDIPERDGTERAQFAPYVEREGLPHAIIVDLDGTLFHIDPENPRSPYDGARVEEDVWDDVIAGIVSRYADAHSHSDDYRAIFLVSGRSEEYREPTIRALAKAGFDLQDELFMRGTGDVRKDDIVKDEIFERELAGRFNIDFVLDDRDRVVKMWRAKGIRVLQVADGNF